jgi:hypothetical protein
MIMPPLGQKVNKLSVLSLVARARLTNILLTSAAKESTQKT